MQIFTVCRVRFGSAGVVSCLVRMGVTPSKVLLQSWHGSSEEDGNSSLGTVVLKRMGTAQHEAQCLHYRRYVKLLIKIFPIDY
jgi:hypothetical protein